MTEAFAKPMLKILAATALMLTIPCGTAKAQKQYDSGATDTEIKIGNIAPYSGPVSAYGAIAKTAAAYFNKVNAEGGINGRKIKYVTYDDAYSPPKTVEQARRLVESDEVLLIFGSVGTPPNTAIQKYMNSKKIPQLFVATGATKWNDPQRFPWTIGWQPNYQSEGRIYAKYLLKEKPNAKIAVLYENNDYGKDYLQGLKDGLGSKSGAAVVAEEGYETSEPTIDSRIVKLKASGADVFFNVSSAKFAAQAIKKNAEIGWRPLHILNNVAISIGSVMKPAGFENSQGIISSAYMKDPTDASWSEDDGMKKFDEFLKGNFPEGNRADALVVLGYSAAQTMVQVLKNCGDDLTRANIMKQVASLNRLELDLLLPGITITTGPDDFAPIEQLQLQRFEDGGWRRFGDIYGANAAD